MDGDKSEVVGKGDGNLDEIKACLKDDRVQYGGFRVDGVDERGGVTSRRAKLIFFSFIGENVPVMKKAKSRAAVADAAK